MKKNLLLISTFSILASASFAQLRQYGTRDYIEFLKSKDNLEKPFSGEQRETKLSTTLSLTFVLLTKDISKDQLLKQVKSLNQDFSNQTFRLSENQSPHYKQLATNTEIQFCENFELIEDYSEEKIDFALGQEYAKKHSQRHKNSILVFVTDLEKMAGYTQTPGYSPETDVIIIDRNYLLGANTEGYDLGKTLSHLLGTYLGLGELWGCVDDGIDDTPLMSVEHYDHEGSMSSCYRYVVNTMPQNFMYNTSDKYQNIFTEGQKERMLIELSTRRQSLLESPICK